MSKSIAFTRVRWTPCTSSVSGATVVLEREYRSGAGKEVAVNAAVRSAATDSATLFRYPPTPPGRLFEGRGRIQHGVRCTAPWAGGLMTSETAVRVAR